jgi:hypothetical protein
VVDTAELTAIAGLETTTGLTATAAPEDTTGLVIAKPQCGQTSKCPATDSAPGQVSAKPPAATSKSTSTISFIILFIICLMSVLNYKNGLNHTSAPTWEIPLFDHS